MKLEDREWETIVVQSEYDQDFCEDFDRWETFIKKNKSIKHGIRLGQKVWGILVYFSRVLSTNDVPGIVLNSLVHLLN